MGKQIRLRARRERLPEVSPSGSSRPRSAPARRRARTAPAAVAPRRSPGPTWPAHPDRPVVRTTTASGIGGSASAAAARWPHRAQPTTPATTTITATAIAAAIRTLAKEDAHTESSHEATVSKRSARLGRRPRSAAAVCPKCCVLCGPSLHHHGELAHVLDHHAWYQDASHRAHQWMQPERPVVGRVDIASVIHP
jgi:hypothetical protein